MNGIDGNAAQRAGLDAHTAEVLARRAAWVAQVEDAASSGATVATVATRFGMARKAVTGRLRRAERRDLIAALTANAGQRTRSAGVASLGAVAARRAAFVEDAEWMARTGETAEGAAVRFGVATQSLRGRLSDLGRLDLWEALRANAEHGAGARAGRVAGRRAA
jgi:hypothetical protein